MEGQERLARWRKFPGDSSLLLEETVGYIDNDFLLAAIWLSFSTTGSPGMQVCVV